MTKTKANAMDSEQELRLLRVQLREVKKDYRKTLSAMADTIFTLWSELHLELARSATLNEQATETEKEKE